MPAPTTRRPGAALAIAALLIAGLAAPASASPWSDTWEHLAGWFARTPLGALWAGPAPRQILGNEGMMVDPSGRPVQAVGGGTPQQVLGNQGMMVDPNGRPVQILSDEGMMVDPNGVPRP